jgi:hypothetical protein
MNSSLVYFNFLQPLLGWLAILSLFTFILSLVLIPWVVGRLAEDCFLKLYRNDRSIPPSSLSSLSSVIMLIIRNGLGLLLVLAGTAMLFFPGQGLLTILLGALLLSFPGKHKLIKGLVRQPKIQHSLDWLRNKRGKPPFLWP